jgi:hypothetical protein
MSKSGIRKGKDFIKNMEKLKKIYGGKIPKSLTIEEADKTLKKVTPIKKKNGGTAKKNKKKKDPTTTRFKRVRDTILLAPEAVEIGKDILLNLPMNVGGMTKHSFPKRRNNGGVVEGIKKIKEGDKRNTMAQPKQGFDTRKAKNGKVRGMTKRPLSDYKRMRRRVGKMLTGGQSKIDMNKNNKIDAEDFKILRARKMKNGGSIIVKSKLVKNKPTKIL